MGGKVLVPTEEAINKLVAARLAADVAGVPTILIARTDAKARELLTTDIDERDQPFHRPTNAPPRASIASRAGIDMAIARGLAYAPYADLIWCETSTPDLTKPSASPKAIHARVSRQAARLQLLAVLQLEEEARRRDDRQASSASCGAMGYKFQFVTLAGFHALNFVDVRAGARLQGAAA